jgi:hypothetical protein
MALRMIIQHRLAKFVETVGLDIELFVNSLWFCTAVCPSRTKPLTPNCDGPAGVVACGNEQKGEVTDLTLKSLLPGQP